MLENNEAITSYQIKGRYPNYKSFIRQHRQIKNSSLILNLDIVKSSIFMSQISANDKIYVKQILSTQNNYSPLLFVLTQQKDRTKLIIASSINETNEKLYSVNKLLGNDIRYDWVNYSTIVGLELLKTKKSILFDNIEVINNQVQYPSILYKTNKNSFVPYVNK
jgi:SRSO17 transposase